ncbi:nicotinate-nucleotide--dimethylbenzimidazole phosphoribosyltransferase [Corynebacterium caspium]|uniref:nicotinate-nucleotide--dimethylbenzimidazole phosphoribosyltransferase n=1 Tax=Corynebacterium caspium TaxID=234828 RepID=UPI00036DFE60|nr:nicotinate-nucleotide--dimethylbenzimidazole phosphoribosyltransferase [Corynebacterium caspium]WKD58962.1 Nicotinate-nucleotide--dimethylbenzimidazole phosphoribosyltransferase [Corynebacterium caspium DSM 44850]
MNPTELFQPVSPPDGTSQLNTDFSTAELGSLVEVAKFLGRCEVRPGIENISLIAMAGDLGLAPSNTATPVTSGATSSTGSMVAADLLNGAGPTAALARAQQVSLNIIDASLASDIPGLAADTRVTSGTKRVSGEDVLSREELLSALALGAAAADSAIDSGVDMIIPAALAPQAELLSKALLGVLTGTEPVAVLGFLGTDDAAWIQELESIRDLMFQGRQHRYAGMNLLSAIGSADFAALVGLIARAASRRTPLLLDTLPIAVCALLAEGISPGTKQWLLAGQLTREPAHRLALRTLDCTALFALNIPLGRGFGALAALPLVRAASELLI